MVCCVFLFFCRLVTQLYKLGALHSGEGEQKVDTTPFLGNRRDSSYRNAQEYRRFRWFCVFFLHFHSLLFTICFPSFSFPFFVCLLLNKWIKAKPCKFYMRKVEIRFSNEINSFVLWFLKLLIFISISAHNV